MPVAEARRFESGWALRGCVGSNPPPVGHLPDFAPLFDGSWVTPRRRVIAGLLGYGIQVASYSVEAFSNDDT